MGPIQVASRPTGAPARLAASARDAAGRISAGAGPGRDGGATPRGTGPGAATAAGHRHWARAPADPPESNGPAPSGTGPPVSATNPTGQFPPGVTSTVPFWKFSPFVSSVIPASASV